MTYSTGINDPYGQAVTSAPAVTAWNTVASYADYAQAQAAVDRLAEAGFPIGELEIVGSGLRSVERVTGRFTAGRAAGAGAASGAWIGLFVGLIVGLFTFGPAWIGLIVGGILIGAAFGALFGLASWAWGRKRPGGFSSLQTVVATRYDVIALDGTASRARAALGLDPSQPHVG